MKLETIYLKANTPFSKAIQQEGRHRIREYFQLPMKAQLERLFSPRQETALLNTFGIQCESSPKDNILPRQVPCEVAHAALHACEFLLYGVGRHITWNHSNQRPHVDISCVY